MRQDAAPESAPTVTPIATGAAMVVATSPRARNTSAPAPAVTPIMKVAGRARNLERQVHDVVHRHHLERARSDPEQPRHQPRDHHKSAALRNVYDFVVNRLAAEVGHLAGEFETFGERSPLVRMSSPRLVIVKYADWSIIAANSNSSTTVGTTPARLGADHRRR